MDRANPDVQTWKKLLEQCLLQRVPASQFETFATLLRDRTMVSSEPLAQVVLRPQSSTSSVVDPLKPIYIETLVRIGLVFASDVLNVLLQRSRLNERGHEAHRVSKTNKKDDPVQWLASTELVEMVLHGLARLFVAGQRPRVHREVLGLLKVLSTWMTAVVTASSTDIMHDVTGEAYQALMDARALTEAVGLLMTAVAESPGVLKVLTKPCPKGTSFSQINTTFAMNRDLRFVVWRLS